MKKKKLKKMTAIKVQKLSFLIRNSDLSLSQRWELMGNLLSKLSKKEFRKFSWLNRNNIEANLKKDISWIHLFPDRTNLPKASFFFIPQKDEEYRRTYEEVMEIETLVQYSTRTFEKYIKLNDTVPHKKENIDNFIESYIDKIKSDVTDCLDRIIVHSLVCDRLSEDTAISLKREIEDTYGSNILIWMEND